MPEAISELSPWAIVMLAETKMVQSARQRTAAADQVGLLPVPPLTSRASVLHGGDTCRKGASLFFDAPDLAVMPHKVNAARRHHIPRPKRRVTNWSK